ncbi:MAG: sugar transferase, partial [Eubacterium sp.]|nr:sugar transferase [Eubacterium sp.]
PMETASTFKNCFLTYSLFSVLLLLTKNDIIHSRYLWISSLFTYCLLSLIMRFLLKRILLKYMPSSKLATMTGVITTIDRAEEFIADLKHDWSKNIKAVALVDASFENGVYKKHRSTASKNGNILIDIEDTDILTEIDGVPVVANVDNLMGWIRTSALDEIYINLSSTNNSDYEDLITEYVEELEDMGITVNVNISTLEKIIKESKFDNLKCEIKAERPMAVFAPSVHNQSELFIKRIMDIIGGLIGSIISLPIILITAIPLLLESPGPLIFKQQRIGKNGRVFNIYKLRSMYTDAEERKKALMEQNKMDGFMFKMDNDPRITKVGKFIRKTSIDELPQFWNVLKGDMSLVGTRPPTVDEFEQYESHHKRRLSLKPGITGLWQVSGRSNIQDFEEVVKLDCKYIDN